MNSKANIRTDYLKKRNSISTTAQKNASYRIYKQVRSLFLYQKAQHIAAYQSIGKEINMQSVLDDALKQHKQVYLPVIQADETLRFVALDKQDTLVPNCFNILEPTGEKTLDSIETLDIIFVPLVAFDKRGVRLGRGKGYYDKTFEKKKPRKIIGIAYACQYYPGILPNDEWDVPLDAIITEDAIMWFE